MTSNLASRDRFKVVIAGGGVAGLEAAMALQELAGDRISTLLLAPNEEFVYRPMTVREPFAFARAHRYPLDGIAADIGAELVVDSFAWLDPNSRVVHTARGAELGYDALLLALGADRYERYAHALTLDDSRLDEQLHGLIQDIEDGYVHSLAFVAPSRMAWPLPIYELALMTAARAYEMNVHLSITIATPEDAPLAIFGATVSNAVRELLEDREILTITSTHCEVLERGRVALHPGGRELHVDRIVALPELTGPSISGVPRDGVGGFIRVDPFCRVADLEHVFAAGDATNFAIKFGGIAAQQADTAAEGIAALAGAPITPKPFRPVIRGILLGGDEPLYMSAHVTGGHGVASEISTEPLWSPPTKIVARHLAPYLDRRDRATTQG
jgi:sulfide:quinone oxidoreductase